MEKLKIHHLAPYLPYGLLCKWNKSKPLKLIGLQYGNESVNNELWTFKDNDEILMGYLYECKPLMKTLENLSTNKKLNRYLKENIFDGLKFMMYETSGLTGITIGDTKTLIVIDDEVADDCPMFIFDWLVKNHYDVFGLIRKGLAEIKK